MSLDIFLKQATLEGIFLVKTDSLNSISLTCFVTMAKTDVDSIIILTSVRVVPGLTVISG